jgi:bifunctional non-homologous end joining protein LigD
LLQLLYPLGLLLHLSSIHTYNYDQTRAFAESVRKILVDKYPEKITTVWDTTQRRGKVFFDNNQNAKGKTIASVFSARPSVSALL